MDANVRLKAVAGDIVGMGGTGEGLYRDVPAEHFGLVETFLRCQSERMLEYYRSRPVYPGMPAWGRMDVLYRREDGLGDALIDAGVFESKWDKRSQWILTDI